MRYTLKQLTYFVAAAELEGVSAASERLNISQPSISAAIAHLERALDVQLFMRRHAQGVSLTPAGRRALVEARHILAQAGEFASRVAGDESIEGELDLGCFLTFSPYYVPGLLSAFKKQHPNVEVKLHEGDTESLSRGLANGALDLALVYDMALAPELEREPLLESTAYALLPNGHPLSRRRSVSLAALAREQFVLLDLPHSRDYFLSIFLRYGLEPNVRYHTTSLEMMRGMIANGHGVGLLNLYLPGDRSYDGELIACRPVQESLAPLRILLARLKSTRPTRVAEAFAACARDYFAQCKGRGTFQRSRTVGSRET